MSYSVYVCETTTGRNLGPVDAKVNSWTRELNGTDTASVSIYPGALTTSTRDNLRLITQPPRMTLVIEWNTAFAVTGPIVFAGPIWARNWTGTQLDVNAVGVRSLLKSRKALMWTIPYQSQTLSYSNMSLGTMVSRLVAVATSGTKGGAALPIVYPPDQIDADPTHVRTYNGYALSNVDQMITELTNVNNGPDVDFTPSWTDSTRQYFQYTLRVGTNEIPKLSQPQQVMFDASAQQSSVKLLTQIEDASVMATTYWSLGSGDGTGVLMSVAQSATLINNGWPLLEQQTDYKTVADQPTLDAHTAGDLAAFASPTLQFGLHIDVTQPPEFGTYLVGDQALVRVVNHVWIPDSPVAGYPVRMVKISGDSSTTVTLDVQNA